MLAALALCLVAATPGWRWPADRAPPAVPVENAMSAARVELGRRLFYEADLSVDGTMACATCHEQKHGFTDGNRTHAGVHGDPGRRNVPGLANVAWRRALTWGDSTMRALEAQAHTPIAGDDPVEMGMKDREAELARRLGGDVCYARMFARAFPAERGRIDMDTVTAALAVFERTLISDDAPYDRWRRGDRAALSATALAGEALFRAHCASCHAGPDLTDDDFHRVATGPVDPADRGLGKVTGRPEDDGKFRTPSLRNVAVGAPYFHDGASSTLHDAIRRHGDVALAADDVTALTVFLAALTDTTFLAEPRFGYPEKACGKRL